MLLLIVGVAPVSAFGFPFANWSDHFFKSDFECRNFDFGALVWTGSSFLNNNIETRNTGSDSQGGWQDVFARVASWTCIFISIVKNRGLDNIFM